MGRCPSLTCVAIVEDTAITSEEKCSMPRASIYLEGALIPSHVTTS
jgi:hypothetical protein